MDRATAHRSVGTEFLPYDVLIVGGGPAGLSAALSLARFRRSVLLLDAGEQRHLPSHAVHNYLGRDDIAPRELLARGRAEARQAGAELREARVTHIRQHASSFVIALDGQPVVTARRIVLATSLVNVQPGIENFAPFVGTSVFHCPLCDAAAFTDRPMVVISWGPKAAGYTLELRHWTPQLTLVTHEHPIDEAEQARLARHGVRVCTERVQRLEGQDGLVTRVVLVSGATIRCDAVFFNSAHRPRNALTRALGCALEPEGYVKVDEHYQTTVRHVYAAGDITAREESVADAVAEGF